MYYKNLKYILCGGIVVTLFMLTACGTPATTGKTTNQVAVSPAVSQNTPTATPIVVATSTATTGTGPVIIPSPTQVPGGNPKGQQITLQDRILTIETVSKQ